MFNKILPKILHETIITRNMVVNVEADINYSIPENAFFEHLHISHLLAKQHKVLRYDKKRSNGFTILIKEEDNAFSYQVAVCSLKDNFSRLHGRYFAAVRAKTHGWVDVPQEALQYADESLYSKQLAVVNHFIRTVHNKNKELMVSVPDSAFPMALSTFTPTMLATFEDVAKATVGAGYKVKYSKNTHTGKVLALFVADPLASETMSEQEYAQICKAAREMPIATVPLTPYGQMNKWYDRYCALYSLFTIMTNRSKVID